MKKIFFTTLMITSFAVYAQSTREIKVKPHLNLSIFVPELSVEIPAFGGKSTSVRLAVRTIFELTGSRIEEISPGVSCEFRKYFRKEQTSDVFEGGYIQLFGSGLFLDHQDIYLGGAYIGHQNYFGKKEGMFYDLGVGVRYSEEGLSFEESGLFPYLQLKFGFKIL